jgi:hypothetical protein
MNDFSQLLPHRGGVSPIIAHKIPYLPIREHDPSVVRMNG